MTRLKAVTAGTPDSGPQDGGTGQGSAGDGGPVREILLRYHEIALKGENRGWFEERLAVNARKLVQRAVGQACKVTATREHGRVIVRAPWTDPVKDALKRVFGIANFSPMRGAPTSLPELEKASVEEFSLFKDKFGMPGTFRIFTRRSEKALPETSMEIDRRLGTAVQARFPDAKVRMKDPELVLGVEIRKERSYLWLEKETGAGGMPVGTNGRVLTLLSGGIDSPVAALKIIKRGAETGFVHFYGAPFVGPEVLEKVEDLARRVNQFQPDPMPLHVVPFGKIQERIALVTHPKMRTLLYRRMMIRIAERLARELKYDALVTGECLGQVSSQTLDNLTAIDRVAEMTLLRPLISYDKPEIIAAAQAWGTYETSILPGADCCTLFADRHPTLGAPDPIILEQESRFDIAACVEEAFSGAERRRL